MKPMGDGEDRQAILARRARLIATALAGLAVTAPPACSEDVVTDDAGQDDGSVGAGGGTPQPCLSQQIGGEGGRPQPCLGQRAGGEGGEGGSGGSAGAGGGGGAGGVGGSGGSGGAP
jgi:hypothetical protein